MHGDDEVGTLNLTMYGADADILVMSPEEYKLARHMHEPQEVDLGNFVLSPMPGTLISFAVEVSNFECIFLYVFCLRYYLINNDLDCRRETWSRWDRSCV